MAATTGASKQVPAAAIAKASKNWGTIAFTWRRVHEQANTLETASSIHCLIQLKGNQVAFTVWYNLKTIKRPVNFYLHTFTFRVHCSEIFHTNVWAAHVKVPLPRNLLPTKLLRLYCICAMYILYVCLYALYVLHTVCGIIMYVHTVRMPVSTVHTVCGILM